MATDEIMQMCNYLCMYYVYDYLFIVFVVRTEEDLIPCDYTMTLLGLFYIVISGVCGEICCPTMSKIVKYFDILF